MVDLAMAVEAQDRSSWTRQRALQRKIRAFWIGGKDGRGWQRTAGDCRGGPGIVRDERGLLKIFNAEVMINGESLHSLVERLQWRHKVCIKRR